MQQSPAPLNPIGWTASRSTKCMLAKAMQRKLYGSATKQSTSAKAKGAFDPTSMGSDPDVGSLVRWMHVLFFVDLEKALEFW